MERFSQMNGLMLTLRSSMMPVIEGIKGKDFCFCTPVLEREEEQPKILEIPTLLSSTRTRVD